MREVELKAHVDDWAVVKEKIESFCGIGNIVSKRDQYFHRPGEKHQAFRIRDNNGNMELTSKKTGLNENGENNLEFEFSAPIGEYDKAIGFFENLGYEMYFRKYKNGILKMSISNYWKSMTWASSLKWRFLFLLIHRKRM